MVGMNANVRPDRSTANLAIRAGSNWLRTKLYILLRCPYLRHRGLLRIPWSVSIWSPNHLVEFGDCVQFGPRCVVQCDIKIGSHVLIASDVAFIGRCDHQIDIIGKTIWDSPRGLSGTTVLGDDCWIGHGAIILSNLTIGRGSVVAAGSVVTSDVRPYSVVAGVPAKEIRRRFTDEEILLHESAILHLDKITQGI